MKEMNETQLRGWRPRQPSAGLKRRIFRAVDGPAMDWHWHRLAPAMACMFFATMLLHFNGGGSLLENKPVMFVDFGKGGSAPVFSDRAQEVENHVASVTFDWTNHSGFKSSIGSRIGFGPSTNFSN